MEPAFLTVEDVLEIHRDQIIRYGGSPELRDLGLLQSALAMPMAGFGGEYLHEGLAEMAAAYHFHLVKNHAFVDGNKRVGSTAARVFVMLNGGTFDPPEDEYEALTLATAAGENDKAAVANFFRKYVVTP